MLSKTLLVALAATGAVAVTKYNNSTEMLPDLNTDNIDDQTRARWCAAQTNTCSTLCTGTTGTLGKNFCNTEDLTYNCTCSNGTDPNLTIYKQTMPTLVCQECYSQCITKNEHNATGQRECTNYIQKKCGTNDAKVPSDDSSSTTSSVDTTSSTASDTTPSPTKEGVAALVKVPGQGLIAAVAAFGVFAYLI